MTRREFFLNAMDTVPPFIAQQDDEKIYGRGACDAKGIIASQISRLKNSENKTSTTSACCLRLTKNKEVLARAANKHKIASRCNL